MNVTKHWLTKSPDSHTRSDLRNVMSYPIDAMSSF